MGSIEDKMTATKNPGGMDAPVAPAIKLQMLLSPAPMSPTMAPAFSAFKSVKFCVSIVI